MNFITEARDEIKELLTGYNVSTFRPEKITPPLIVVEPGDDYVRPGQTFDEWQLSLVLTCAVKTQRNKETTESVDELICDVIEKLRGHWTVTGAQTVFVSDNSNEYPAALISITTNL